MPPLYRFIEVGVYSLLNFLPFLALAIYPFRLYLRFSKKVTAILICFASAVQLLLGFWASFFSGGHTAMISLLSTVVYAALFFLAVRSGLGRILFTLLMLSNIANFIVMASKCLEGLLFHENALQSYRWSFSLCMIVVEACILIPLFIYVKKTYSPAMNLKVHLTMWRYMWIIPATFYVVWSYMIYGNSTESSLEIALKPVNVLILFFINLGAFLVHYIVIQLANETVQNLKLAEKNHHLTMQTLQYDNLNTKIEEARKANHDLRHHMTVISGLLDSGKEAELAEYLHSYLTTTPDFSAIVFCGNPALNALILYFAQLAKDNDVDFDARLNVPEDLPVNSSDIAVLFGNLLENAVQA